MKVLRIHELHNKMERSLRPEVEEGWFDEAPLKAADAAVLRD